MGVNEGDLQVVVSLSFHLSTFSEKKTFSSKVGIEPPSTPLLGFQGSRGSRKIKK